MGNCCTKNHETPDANMPVDLKKTPQLEGREDGETNGESKKPDEGVVNPHYPGWTGPKKEHDENYRDNSKEDAINNQILDPSVKTHTPESSVAQPIDAIPENTNQKTVDVLKTLDHFVFNEDEPEDRDLPELGPMLLSSGAVYVGKWKYGVKHGKGTQYWPDGSQYTGYWRNNTANGKGRLVDTDGGYYIGRWKDDKADGQGTYKWADGGEYTGEWKNNKMHGQGLFKWSDGREYEGEFVEDKKQGFGVYKMPDGKKYEGLWENGKLHGRGKYYSSKGYTREGIWENGKLIKWVQEEEKNPASQTTLLICRVVLTFLQIQFTSFFVFGPPSEGATFTTIVMVQGKGCYVQIQCMHG
eukprot:TRINITY_DN14437_c0_g1_i1.p1 TRINITY_DN14437_c0_g1~~TRINITY_DN14437_c0_g1_i1.p1  ORF type:complete len:356 (+),score=23.81 TRINITY_DN14437_c0_g1_i1:1-1068(+)